MCCVQVREHTSHLEAELEKHMAAASAACQNYATEVAGVSVPAQVGLVGALRPGQGAARSAWQREDLSTQCGDTISAGKAFKSECFLGEQRAQAWHPRSWFDLRLLASLCKRQSTNICAGLRLACTEHDPSSVFKKEQKLLGACAHPSPTPHRLSGWRMWMCLVGCEVLTHRNWLSLLFSHHLGLFSVQVEAAFIRISVSAGCSQE